VIDWAQTRVEDPARYEKNPILGKDPHSDKIDAYFAFWLVTNYVVYKKAPEKYSKPYLWVFNIVQAVTISRNIQVGVRF
jgi:hypothetical protein